MKRYMAGKRGAIAGYKFDESTVKGFISDLPMADGLRVFDRHWHFARRAVVWVKAHHRHRPFFSLAALCPVSNAE